MKILTNFLTGLALFNLTNCGESTFSGSKVPEPQGQTIQPTAADPSPTIDPRPNQRLSQPPVVDPTSPKTVNTPNGPAIAKNDYQTTTTPQQARPGCQAYFSGQLISDHRNMGNFSKIYEPDAASEWVGAGRYASNLLAFPKAVLGTFDGIAFDRGTKVTIYWLPNFMGGIAFEMEGPAVIQNDIWRNPRPNQVQYLPPQFYIDDMVRSWNAKIPGTNETYEKRFPRNIRLWSNGNMHSWSYGSVEVSCLRN